MSMSVGSYSPVKSNGTVKAIPVPLSVFLVHLDVLPVLYSEL